MLTINFYQEPPRRINQLSTPQNPEFIKLKKFVLLTILFIFIAFPISSLYAVEKSPTASSEKIRLPHQSPYYEQESSYTGDKDTKAMEVVSSGPVRKLGRGFSNILFGIFEVLIQPYKVNETEGGIAAMSYGIFKGLFYFAGRVVVGVVDMVTFPMPLPGASPSKYSNSSWGYGPLIEPEWIFTIEDNPYNFIYQNYPPNTL